MKATRLCSIMLGLLLTTAVQASVVINEETFPDEDFRSVIANMPEGKDGVLTDEEINSITNLTISSSQPKPTNLKGIEYLKDLKVLDCWYCFLLTELDLSANTALEFVRMEFVLLESLNVSGLSSLRHLLCHNSFLSKLDVSTCSSLQYLSVLDGCLIELDLSNNINLKEVYLWNNQLSTLDLSNNINLEKIDCSYNQLTSLILPQSETLKDVKCCANHLYGESMDQLVASLPTVSKGDFYPYIEIADADDEGPQTEFNVCTTSQVEAAKSKNWTVYGRYHIGSGLWDEYAGSEPTSIRPAIQGNTASDCYSLDGRHLNNRPTRKGIYIQNGKKVVIK